VSSSEGAEGQQSNTDLAAKGLNTESFGHGLKLFITPVDLSFHAHTSVFLFPDLKDL
jgi:hypothetical protein